MLYRWALATCQAAIYILLWPRLTLAGPADPASRASPDRVEPSKVSLPDGLVTAPPDQTVLPTLLRRDGRKSAKSTTSTTSAAEETPTPSTSGTKPKFKQNGSAVGHARSPQHGLGSGRRISAAISRAVVLLRRACSKPGQFLDRNRVQNWDDSKTVHRGQPSTSSTDASREVQPSTSGIDPSTSGSSEEPGHVSWQIGSSESDSDSEEYQGESPPQLMNPEQRQIRGNLTLFFGDFHPPLAWRSQLPHPRPTSYAPDGTPEYEFWYEWPRLSWRERTQPRDRPVQLIPKRGGCYLPIPGSVGSWNHECPRRGNKNPLEGWIPYLPDFPGAPGSAWFFQPPEPLDPEVGPPRHLPVNLYGGRYGDRPPWHNGQVQSMIFFMDSNVDDPFVATVCALVSEIYLLVLSEIPGVVTWEQFSHPYIMADLIIRYTPHFVEVLSILWDYMSRRRSKREKPAAGTHTSTNTSLSDAIRKSMETYEAPERGLYVDCFATTEHSKGQVIGNYTKKEFCGILSLFSQMSTQIDLMKWTPTFSIDCGPPAKGATCGPLPTAEPEGPIQTVAAEQVPHTYSEDAEEEDVTTIHLTREDLARQLAASESGCGAFSELEFELKLDGGNRSATRDSIFVSINNGADVFVTRKPWSGYHDSIKIDVRKLFKKDRIPMRDIYRISLISQMEEDPSDGWGLQGIRLRGKCFDSTFKWQVDKYAKIRRWMYRGANKKRATVWSDNISPQDWHEITILDTCDSFDSLKLSIVRGPSGDGGQDIAFIGFGEEGKQPIQLQIEEPGFQDWQFIDIKRIWDTPTVCLDQIKGIHIKQLHTGDVENQGWIVQSIG
ncbi:hypothetical protein XA68_13758 [Ophiocordyceps unilateralis]|uniref:Uncharacterized protein n=1 Tax=Ophiocordyceps unilateralis TaxID=268505 RepID=A0A2A9PBV7_OPHUN|nr:hypothetical protein XA68_13758 [Ophiocordyceps unilateralis]